MKEKKYNSKGGKKMQSFWLRLWKLVAPSQKSIKILLVLTALFEISRLVSPYILKIIIDKLTNFSHADIIPLVFLVILMFLSGQMDSFFGYFKDKRIFKIMIDIEYYLPIAIQKKLVYLSLGYHERENTGNKISKAERGINKIIDLFANLSWEVGPTIIQLVLTLSVLFIMDWRFGLSLFMFAPLFILLTYKVNKDLYPTRKKRHKNYEVAYGIMGQSIININTVKSFVQERKEINKFQSIRQMIKVSELKEWYKLLRFNLGRNLIIDLGRITILFLGIYLVWQGSVTIGTLVFVVTLSEKSYFSLWRLSRFYDRMEEGAEAVNRFMDLLAEKQKVINPSNGIKPKNIAGRIEFRGLDFSYRGAEDNALNKVDLTINAGCITALVGPSGGGKTTVARMIYRHYDPQGGGVFLDGQDLRKYDLFAFRKFIAIVPQEVEIFDTSIGKNIAYANPEAGFREIESAVRIANAEEFIEKLPRRYETEVGERGIKLSGGQRQRIGIARAVLANPKILIFDEATSNLDSYSEKLIQEALDKVCRDRTVIIIAHRLSTIKRADKIIVLEEGRVVEQGSHLELARAKGGLYAKLLKLQEMGDVA